MEFIRLTDHIIVVIILQHNIDEQEKLLNFHVHFRGKHGAMSRQKTDFAEDQHLEFSK